MIFFIGILLSIAVPFFFHGFQPLPFQVSKDMTIDTHYEKRAEIPQKDQLNFIYYTDEAKKLIETSNDFDLMNFRCSDSFVRTVQGAYVLENAKTELREKRRIKNFDFIEFMRNKERTFPPGKKILSGRICELEDNTIILMYSIGTYDSKNADSQTPRLVVLNSSSNNSFLQVISKGIFAKTESIMKIRESKDHVRCDRLFQISKTYIAHMLCEEKGDFVSSFFVYRINLKLESFEILKTCVNRYEEGLKISCY